MVKCGVCGAENEAEAMFCGACGSRLRPEVAEEIVKAADETATPGVDEDIVIPTGGGRDRARAEEGGEGTSPPPDEGTDTVPVGGGPTVTCQVCGTVNDATRTYCRKCANELRPAAAPPPPPPPPPTGRKISPLVLGLGAAALLVVVVIGVVLSGFLGPGDDATATATPGSPTTGPSTPTGTDGPGPTDTPTATPPVITEPDTPPGRIVFARCPQGGGPCELVLRNADGSGGGTRITGTAQGAGDPGWSTDGRRIAYSTTAGLRILTLETGFPWIQATDNGTDTNAFWAAGDETLAFSRNQAQGREIRLFDVPNGSSERLTDNDVEDHDPVFTPDGQTIIWVEGVGNDRELARMDLATGDVDYLTDDGFNDVDPVVSPDGTRLAFVSNRESDGAFELFVMDLATLQITRLFGVDDGDVHDPAWSPGGRFLVVSAGPARNRDILIFDTVSGDVIVLTSNADNDTAPDWR